MLGAADRKREVCLNISSGLHFPGGTRSHTSGSSGILRAVVEAAS